MDDKNQLWERLGAIHQRIQWMADEEAVAAWINGLAARGVFMEEKLRLLEEADHILDKIQKY